MNALIVTDANYGEFELLTDKVIVLDFWASWCGPCAMTSPIVDELANDFKGRAIVGKIDADTNHKLVTKFAIRSLPTIIYILNGVVVDKQVGVASKHTLTDKLNALIK